MMIEIDEELEEVALGCTVGFTHSDTSTSVQYIMSCFRLSKVV